MHATRNAATRSAERHGSVKQRHTTAQIALMMHLALLTLHASLASGAFPQMYVKADGTLVMNPAASNGDVVLGGVSIAALSAEIEATTSSNSKLLNSCLDQQDQVAYLSDANRALQNSLSSSNKKIEQLITDMSRMRAAASVCASGPSPFTLPKVYRSLDWFEYESQIFVIGAADSQSTLYRWSPSNSSFHPIQQIQTSTTTFRVTQFRINNQQFVVLPYADPTAGPIRCEMLKFNGSTQLLSRHQNITAYGPIGMTVITTDKYVTYMAVSNTFDGQTPDSYCHIQKFNANTNMFELIQSLETTTATLPEFFHIDSQYYLSLPNQRNQQLAIVSTVYILNDATQRFEVLQEFETNGAKSMKFWSFGSRYYMIVFKYSGFMDMYSYNNEENNFDSMALNKYYMNHVNAADTIMIGSDMYMAISASTDTTALLYKWNTTANGFDVAQTIYVSSGISICMYVCVNVCMYGCVSIHAITHLRLYSCL
jgi:hypothetical protein